MRAKLLIGLLAVEAAMAVPVSATVVTDDFSGATLNSMWVLDDEPGSYSGTGSGFAMQPSPGVARFNGVGNNAFAHIESATTYDTTQGFRVDAIMRQDDYPVQTWGMGVAIYFDANNYVALKQSAAGGANGWLRHMNVNGTFAQIWGNGVSDLRTYWLISGVELTPTQIKFYGSPITPKVDQFGVTDIDGNVSEISELAIARPASFTGNATVIVGKGFGATGYAGADLDNSVASTSYSFAGIDYVRITLVPEPGMGLVALGSLAMLSHRSRRRA